MNKKTTTRSIAAPGQQSLGVMAALQQLSSRRLFPEAERLVKPASAILVRYKEALDKAELEAAQYCSRSQMLSEKIAQLQNDNYVLRTQNDQLKAEQRKRWRSRSGWMIVMMPAAALTSVLLFFLLRYVWQAL